MTSLWERTDITVFIAPFSTPVELGEFLVVLKEVCPGLQQRGTENGPPRYSSPESTLCLGWRREPLWSLSWGGHKECDKLWGHEEFLDHVGYNSR